MSNIFTFVTFCGSTSQNCSKFGNAVKHKKLSSQKNFQPPRPPLRLWCPFEVTKHPIFSRFSLILECSLLEAELIFFNSVTTKILVIWSNFFFKIIGAPYLATPIIHNHFKWCNFCYSRSTLKIRQKSNFEGKNI